jgi:hypothetical protein
LKAGELTTTRIRGGATPTRRGVDNLPLLSAFVHNEMPKENVAAYAAMRGFEAREFPLQAGKMRLHAVFVVCSKLTHDGLLFRLSGLRGVIRTCGAIFFI